LRRREGADGETGGERVGMEREERTVAPPLSQKKKKKKNGIPLLKTPPTQTTGPPRPSPGRPGRLRSLHRRHPPHLWHRARRRNGAGF
jgi:hypothetical protein